MARECAAWWFSRGAKGDERERSGATGWKWRCQSRSGGSEGEGRGNGDSSVRGDRGWLKRRWGSGRDGEDRARDTDCSGGEREAGR